jgi:hypothetical protein
LAEALAHEEAGEGEEGGEVAAVAPRGETMGEAIGDAAAEDEIEMGGETRGVPSVDRRGGTGGTAKRDDDGDEEEEEEVELKLDGEKEEETAGDE